MSILGKAFLDQAKTTPPLDMLSDAQSRLEIALHMASSSSKTKNKKKKKQQQRQSK